MASISIFETLNHVSSEQLYRIQELLLIELKADKVSIHAHVWTRDDIDPIKALGAGVKLPKNHFELPCFKVIGIMQFPPIDEQLQLKRNIAQTFSEIVNHWKLRTIDEEKLWVEFLNIYPKAKIQCHLENLRLSDEEVSASFDDEDPEWEFKQDIYDWLISSYVGRERSLKQFQVAYEDSDGKFVSV